MLERFTKILEGQYQCRISTLSGEALLDDVVHSNVTPQALEVLQKAINHRIQRPQKDLLRSKFTISKSLGFDHDAQTLGFEHDPFIPTIDLCVQMLVPNAKSMADSIGISRVDIFNACLPYTRKDAINPWTPQDFYDNVHVPEKDVAIQDHPAINKLPCQLYPFQKRALQWLLWREGYHDAYKPIEEHAALPHGFFRTTDAEGRLCFVSEFLGMVTTDDGLPIRIGSVPRGGILAEEMGLTIHSSRNSIVY